MNTLLRRGLAAAAVTALGAGLVSAPAAQADVSRTPQAVNAADWLSSQVIDGRLINEAFDEPFVDWGLGIDTLLALDAVGGYRSKVADIADALEDNLGSYTTGVDFGSPETQYPGAIAKSLVAAQAAGRAATAFGGRNLVADTESFVDDDGAAAGAIRSSVGGAFANTIVQSLAVRGLVAAGSAEAEKATSFLLRQQCADGGFRESVPSDAAPCEAAGAGGIDATALSVVALASLSDDAEIGSALTRAGEYLVGQQDDNGGFGVGGGADSNANSTGLAATALETLALDGQAADAADWLVQRQVSAYSACGTQLDGEFGAVAFNDLAITQAEEDGIDVSTLDQWRRATAQAIPALQSYDDPEPLPRTAFGVSVTPSTDGLAVPGMPMTVRVTGMAPSERYCVYTPEGTAAKAGRATETGTAGIAATAPTTVGLQPVTVYGERDARQGAGKVRVLPPVKNLPVSLSATKIKRGGSVVVTATGLAPLEKARVSYGGSIVVTGKATSAGTFRYTLRVGTTTGTKSVSVLGLNATRKGTKTFTVVR